MKGNTSVKIHGIKSKTVIKNKVYLKKNSAWHIHCLPSTNLSSPDKQ